MNRRRTLLLLGSMLLLLVGYCGGWLYIQQRQYTRNRALIDALVYSDTKTALALVNAEADPNTRRDPLRAPTFKLLLNQLLHHTPPPVNASPTAFMVACGMDWYPEGTILQQREVVPENLPLQEAMLAHGATVNAHTYENLQALHFASEHGRLHTVELLLSHGADINALDTSHKTPLMFSAFDRTGNTMRLLLAQGANPHLLTTTGNTALHYAVATPGAANTVPLLMAQGLNPNAANKRGTTPLQYARKRKRADLVAVLTQSIK